MLLNRTGWCKATFINTSLSFLSYSIRGTAPPQENYGNVLVIHVFCGVSVLKDIRANTNNVSLWRRYPRYSRCFFRSWQEIPASSSFYVSANWRALLNNSPPPPRILKGAKTPHLQFCTLNHKISFSLLSTIELTILHFWTLTFKSLLKPAQGSRVTS